MVHDDTLKDHLHARNDAKNMQTDAWQWEVARSAEEVHALLCASDVHHATRAIAAPSRSLETTQGHVSIGAVQALRYNNEFVGMFTLMWRPPTSFPLDIFPEFASAIYMQRLAVAPEWLTRDALVGLRCVRKACELARLRGARVLRAEVNPDITAVWQLLVTFGFRQLGPPIKHGLWRKAFMQREL